jgi:sigma-B regulation protein RsbU (phosphoserine phosphatase)
MFGDATYEQESVQLERGDVLMLFSDGVTDAAAADGEQFGDDRLVAWARESWQLAPSLMLQRIFETVLAFSGSSDQSDDVTALFLRFSGS